MCFLALAPKWPKLMQYWTDAEQKLPKFYNSKQKRCFILKVRIIAFTILIVTISMNSSNDFYHQSKSNIYFAVEHLFCLGSYMHFVLLCQKGKDPLLEHIKINGEFCLEMLLRMLISFSRLSSPQKFPICTQITIKSPLCKQFMPGLLAFIRLLYGAI